MSPARPNILQRIAARILGRRLDAATSGRRGKGWPSSTNLGADALGMGRTVRHRARHAAANNAWAASGKRAMVSNLVGTGIKPRSQHPDQARRQTLNRAWEFWSTMADADGRTDVYGVMAQAVAGMVVDGEALIRFVPGKGVIPLALQLLDPDQLDHAMTRELPGGARIVGGVEFDAHGVRLAYHLSPRRPTDAGFVLAQTVRVPAEDVIHLYRSEAVGQVRGLSWFAPVLLALREIDEYGDALLVRAKTQAMFAGFIKNTNGDPQAAFEGEQSGSVLEGGIEPGALKVLGVGEDIEFSTPPSSADGPDFILHMLRAVSAGLGTTYEQITGDMTKVNYSSARVALVEQRRFLEQIQFNLLVPQLCAPIWRRFVTVAALSGALPITDFGTRPADYFAVKWVPPGFAWIDPKKDAEADQVAIAAGLKSRAEAVAERGYDVEEIDREIAEDQARAASLGLDFKKPAAVASTTEKETTDA